MLRYRTICVVGLFLSSLIDCSEAALITFVNSPTDNRFATIQGLTIDSTNYDITFHNDMSFDDVEATLSPTNPITFTTELSARTALDTIVDFLNSQSFTNATLPNPRSGSLQIPYEVSGPNVNFVQEVISSTAPFIVWSDFNQDIANNQGNTASYMTFAPAAAVPEPTSFVLVALLGMFVFIWHRRPKARRSEMIVCE